MITVHRTFWVVIGLLAASIFAASIWGSPIYYRLIYVWGFLIISSWIWTKNSLHGIRLIRRARTTRQQVGQVFEERYEIENKSRLPRLWIAIHDRSSLPGSAGSRVLTWIGGRQSRSYLSYSWLTKRGLFKLGPVEITSGDLFGLFSASQTTKAQVSLLVTPFLVELQYFPSPAGSLPGGRALQRRTLEVTPYAAGVREYNPGDSLNRIHWPTTARRDQLMVKEFEQDPQADVWVFVDAQKFVQAALPDAVQILHTDRILLWRHKPEEVKLPPATMEYAVSVAASVSHYYIYRGHAVGLACAGQTYAVLPAERGERQLGKILETLAFIDGEGDLPILGLTSAQASYMPRGSTVVIITPSTQNNVLMAVEDLERRSMHPVVVLIDAASFGGATGSGDLLEVLSARNVPVLRVGNKDDLRVALQSSNGEYNPIGWWANTQETT